MKLRRACFYVCLLNGYLNILLNLRNWKKVQPFRPWFDQVWPRSKIAQNPLKVCMHGYLSNGYLNSLSNFAYKNVEKIASLRPLLDQLWIMTKITSNLVKVSVQCYLPNAKINLRSNFNSKKLVKKVKLCRVVLLVFGLKGVKIFWNVNILGLGLTKFDQGPK